jgi:hypothetical protein
MVQRDSGRFRRSARAGMPPVANAEGSRAPLPLALFRLAGSRLCRLAVGFRPQLGQVVLAIGHRIDLARLGRVLLNRPAVSAFGQPGHRADKNRMTESDPDRTSKRIPAAHRRWQELGRSPSSRRRCKMSKI